MLLCTIVHIIILMIDILYVLFYYKICRLSICYRSYNESSVSAHNGQTDSYYSDVTLDTNLNVSLITKKKENIFFLKAHKCGSSTVQNIILRYGRMNNLLFALPIVGNYLGHPKLFMSSMINKTLRSSDNKYNIFAHHSRYNPDEVRQVMKPNAAFVTILRDPATLFESLYYYYKFEKKFNVSFMEFKKDPNQYSHLLDSRHGSRFGRNQMCFDLGFNENYFFVDSAVDKFIDVIAQDFHLVMISEFMEASLVLLADLMGWPLEQVVYLDNNVRQVKNRVTLTEEEKQKIRNLNQADTRLYNYFLGIFKRKVEEYGVEKMTQQVERLITMNRNLYNTCVEKKNTKGYANTFSYTLKPGAPLHCYFAAKTELGFCDELREEQAYKLNQLRNIKELMTKTNDTDELLVE